MTVNSKTTRNLKLTRTDEQVQKDLRDWDIVTCARCGARISMLKARMLGGEMFVCKYGCEGKAS